MEGSALSIAFKPLAVFGLVPANGLFVAAEFSLAGGVCSGRPSRPLSRSSGLGGRY